MDLDEDHQPAAAAAEAVVKQEYDDDEDTDDENMDVDLSYIDRLVHDVENDGEEDDSSLDIVSDNDGQDDEAGNPSVNGNENDSKEANCANGTEGENGGEEGKENEALSDDEFEYDSDEESAVEILGKGFQPPSTASRENISEESKAHLYWGVDNACFSDWSIEVTAPQDGGLDATKTYFVHRSALALGPKKSGYFETLFASEHFNESSSNTSRVTLAEDVASSFPDFLDYLYCPPHEARCVIAKGNWRALRYLADYFVIPKLTEEISDFIQNDIRNLQHCEEYLSAIDDTDEKESKFIIALATKACTEMILSIEVGSSLHTIMPPAMFLRVIETFRSSHDIKSLSQLDQYHICRLVVVYIQTHQEFLDERYFDVITRYLHFPDDVKQAGTLAIDLLQIIEETKWMRNKHGIECVCTAALSNTW